VNVNVEQRVLVLHDHLIASAVNQSVETKPWGNPREGSQAGSAMDLREEARLHGLAGWRLGWSGGREPVASAKSALPAPMGKFPSVAKSGYRQLVQTPVHHAIMPGIQCVHTTGEVPRRLFPPGRVTVSYKQAVKGSPEATAAGTRSHWPCPQGCQQSQSSPTTGDERRNRSWSIKSVIVFGIVSPAAAATKWPARTSSWQPADLLRNIPRYAGRSI
jgi:hypothetical protein